MRFKNILFKLKYLFAFLIFAVAITFFGEGSLINRFAQWHEISKLESEIAEYQRRFNQDHETLNSLKNDPDALRQVARERYYMKTPDEDIFVIEDEE
jgi:cell division protein FtsB